jgi:hypothetical protein
MLINIKKIAGSRVTRVDYISIALGMQAGLQCLL